MEAEMSLFVYFFQNIYTQLMETKSGGGGLKNGVGVQTLIKFF